MMLFNTFYIIYPKYKLKNLDFKSITVIFAVKSSKQKKNNNYGKI